jgi:hypothetical protein
MKIFKKLVDGDEARKPKNQELSTMPSNVEVGTDFGSTTYV